MSEVIKRGFGGRGYKLATVDTPPGVEPRLIEVFPHVALLELLKARTRICYKVGKTVRYWPGADLSVRKKKLLGELERALTALKREIRGVSFEIPTIDQVIRGRHCSYMDAETGDLNWDDLCWSKG